VDAYLARFSFEGGTVVTITASDEDSAIARTLPLDCPISIQTLFERWIDLQSPPSRKSLINFLDCAQGKTEADDDFIADFREDGEGGLYTQLVEKKRMTMLEIADMCPHLSWRMEDVFYQMPKLKPRLYSISSSPLASKSEFTITVGVVSGKTPTGRCHLGVCSNYLASSDVGSAHYVSIRDTGTKFRLPKDDGTPVIMIGAGTGVAPFMGFLQDRKSHISNGATLGDALLFFGCRRPDHDFIYEAEFQSHIKSGSLTELHTAFSRAGDEKRYVQHVLYEQREAVWNLLRKGACVYVCGDGSKMAPDVMDCFARIAYEFSDSVITLQQAKNYVTSLAVQGKYFQDVWGA